MKNKVINLLYSDFTLDECKLTIPQDYNIFEGSSQTFIPILYYPESIRLNNYTNITITYTTFDSDEEYDDYLRDPTNLHDHLDIPMSRRDVLRGIGKSKYINFKVSGVFTGSIKVELIDYKDKG